MNTEFSDSLVKIPITGNRRRFGRFNLPDANHMGYTFNIASMRS